MCFSPFLSFFPDAGVELEDFYARAFQSVSMQYYAHFPPHPPTAKNPPVMKKNENFKFKHSVCVTMLSSSYRMEKRKIMLYDVKNHFLLFHSLFSSERLSTHSPTFHIREVSSSTDYLAHATIFTIFKSYSRVSLAYMLVFCFWAILWIRNYFHCSQTKCGSAITREKSWQKKSANSPGAFLRKVHKQ